MEQSNKIAQQLKQEKPSIKKPKMKWYYFIIYCQVFIHALSGLVSGIILLMDSADQYPQNIGRMVVDIIVGVIMLCGSIYALVVRYKLANFRHNAVVYLYVMCIGNAVLRVLTWFISYYNTDSAFGTFSIIYLVVALVLLCETAIIIFVNHVYFKKRKYLFDGTPMTYNALIIRAEEEFQKKYPYVKEHEGDDWWFAFLIYFMLFASSVLYLIGGVISLIGCVSEPVLSIEFFYDLAGGIVYTSVAILMFVARFLLAAFKKAGVICSHIGFCILAAVAILKLMFLIWMSTLGEITVSLRLILEWIEGIVYVLMAVYNFIYFHKRKYIFS